MFETVVFDLDGTLTDPAVGIVGSFRHALATVGHPVDDDRDLNWIIGPPFRDNLLGVGLPEHLHDEASEVYRRRHTERGLYEATLVDGVPDLLAALKKAGSAVAVATLKPTDQAQLTLDHFGLSPFVDVVVGRRPDVFVADKIDLVATALSEAGRSGAAVMIGDRIHDVEGGMANGCTTVVVDWGYGAPDEFDAHPPDHRVATVAELRSFLLR